MFMSMFMCRFAMLISANNFEEINVDLCTEMDTDMDTDTDKDMVMDMDMD
jgi:hypothetical protein